MTVSGGDVSGINIAVVAPASTTHINAELLGVSNIGEPGSATSNGAIIHRGTNMRVIVFGKGVNGSLTPLISGPADTAISNVRSITSVDGDTGIAFDVAVSPTAALGARSVFLRAANNDLTAFTGGLEVLP